MYPATFCEPFPCGRGYEWTPNENGLFSKVLMTTENISQGSIEWLDYIGTTSRLLNRKGKRCKIVSGWNSEEVKIGKYFVDGFAKVDDKQYIFEYNGCRFHPCNLCATNNIGRSNEDEQIRRQYLQQFGELITMQECRWKNIRQSLNYSPRISKFLFNEIITHDYMEHILTNGEMYGFCLVDLEGTDEAAKWLEMNWPPILVKEDILYSDLPEWMKDCTNEKGFPMNTIVQSMHGTEILLHTILLKYYLENGFKLSKVHKVFEYQGERCFKKIYDTVYKSRVEATEAGDNMKATAVKLTSNSMYGSLLLVSSCSFSLMKLNLLFRIRTSFRKTF